MKTIYRSITPRDNWMPPQVVDATAVAEVRGSRIRVTIHFDTSYAFQTRGEIAALAGGKFEPLLLLHAHEIPFVADYHSMDKPELGKMLRDGDLFERRISAALDVLVQRGAAVLGV